MLRNLPEEGKQQVLRWFNHMWETDTFPDEWRESWVTPIPKAGKPPNTPKNTRPISLPSIMCKLFERIVLARITWIAEDRKLFHAAQTGFRQHLGTRDSLLLLSTDVYRKGSTGSLVAVDVCKAFDLLPHEAIVKALREVGITHKPLNFVKGFLKQRKYSIKTGDICGPLRNNDIGVPRGAVISPILFNLTMAPLAWRLNKISTLNEGLRDCIDIEVVVGRHSRSICSLSIKSEEEGIVATSVFARSEQFEPWSAREYIMGQSGETV
ncbi:hypothetical protein ISCGN_012397 [Ixodes scapularis]